jgi:thiol-disulfide isomerase/thioredoxin
MIIFASDARSCHTCDKVLAELEKIDDDTDNFGVDFIKINDKRLAKKYGIKTFPALTYFREKEPIIYEGECFCYTARREGASVPKINYCPLSNALFANLWQLLQTPVRGI